MSAALLAIVGLFASLLYTVRADFSITPPSVKQAECDYALSCCSYAKTEVLYNSTEISIAHLLFSDNHYVECFNARVDARLDEIRRDLEQFALRIKMGEE
jgi:hypothetical protein